MQSESSATHRGKLDPLPSVYVQRGPPVLRRPANRRLFATTWFATIGVFGMRRHATRRASRANGKSRRACSAAERSLLHRIQQNTSTRERSLMPRPLAWSLIGAAQAHEVAAVHAASYRPPRACVWRLRKRSVVFFNRRPNPSVERTHNGGSRWLAPSQSEAPLRAAHVKR